MNTRALLTTAFSAGLLALTSAAHAGPAVTPLVDTDWLASNLDDPDLAIIDVRSAIDGSNAETFAAGHIPGAVYASYTGAGWREAQDGVPGKLPPVERVSNLIGSLGVDNDDSVVIVPAGVNSTDFGSAARVYWTFKYLGHEDVAILNGGYQAWVDAGGDVATGASQPQAADFAVDLQPELLADTAAVEAALEGGDQLVDARPAAQYSGEAKHPAARAAGTIPGAASLEQQLLVEAGSARFLDRGRVESLIETAGIDGDGPVVSFCNTGHWAATAWFALSEVAGLESVALYDGSMTEWTQDPSLPLAQGQQALTELLN